LQLLDEFLTRKLPDASEQADNFILWLGDRTVPGETTKINRSVDYALFGGNFKAGLGWIMREMTGTMLEAGHPGDYACLSFAGWAKYSELKKGRADARKAFMAMPFGNERLDNVYTVFRAACQQTGFNLMRLDQQPKAGLIDNHLRVEIQTSRFLVADLTYNNNGAYWEGGYAEGLGKPIFYSYENSFFRGKPSHFDANHSYTVLWDFENLAQAAAELKDAIRATLPDEAKMTDD
jgi:nucleoside 2-deoxyribosyltransferase